MVMIFLIYLVPLKVSQVGPFNTTVSVDPRAESFNIVSNEHGRKLSCYID